MPIEGPRAPEAIEQTSFGMLPDGSTACLFTVACGAITATFTDFGARLVSLEAPDRNGHLANVVLGCDSASAYVEAGNYHGAIVGRFANRIANGQFTLGGHHYQVPQNNGANALHGGPNDFSTRLWHAQPIPSGVEMILLSPAGEMGFPGTLNTKVRYTLVACAEANAVALHIDFTATTDAETVVNLTNHAYFNLAGMHSGQILGHHLTLAAGHYTPTNADMIPTGEIASVAGTPFDFRQSTAIGARIDADDLQLHQGRGYDHNFVLGESGVMKFAARLYEPTSGRAMTVDTTEPGIQLYTGNFMPPTAELPYRTGVCLETQHFPDSPNQPGFPSTTLRTGETFSSTTIFTFSAQP